MASSELSMSNYQLGEALGKGASAQVYKALNWTSGETVAIKQISIGNIPEGELSEIMSEIDLLKNLNHTNIVKYRGFFKTDQHLYIILEYCENGSLQTISKRYGKFPEDLVAVYISQVLQGLIYLHSQGVIHRDIKGANILTNKDGTVKLADFGVSTMMPGHFPFADARRADENRAAADGRNPIAVDSSVVGSPYWMAPEIIEQNGAATASDIWSVGCVVIELLEGKPPYYSMEPMQALFRIVQDDMPPIPDGASAVVKDFLYQCFQKDPNLRITAKKLAKHPWMVAVQRQVESTTDHAKLPAAPGQKKETSNPGKPRIYIPKRQHTNRSVTGGSVSATNSTGSSLSAPGSLTKLEASHALDSISKRPLTTVYDQAIQRVQEWNAALNATPKPPLKAVRRRANLQAIVPHKGTNGPASSPVVQSSSGSLELHLSAIANQPQAIWRRNLKNDMTPPATAVPKLREEGDENVWDDDFAESPDLAKFVHGRAAKRGKEEFDNARTIRPVKSHAQSPNLASANSFSVNAPDEPLLGHAVHTPDSAATEDFSADLEFDETSFSQKVLRMRISSSSSRLAKPSETIDGRAPASVPPTPSFSHGSEAALPRPRLISPSSPLRRSISRSSSFKGTEGDEEAAKRTLLKLSKYAEKENEGYDDVFVADEDVRSGSINSNSSDPLRLNVKRADRALQDDEQDDDEGNDPFADIEDSFTAFDVEANLIRDKHAMLCGNINDMIEELQPSSPEDKLRKASQGLLSVLDGSEELQDHFVFAHGMLAVLEVLEAKPSRDVTLNLLKIVNMAVTVDLSVMEHICLTGGIPIIMNFISKRYSLETRLEASSFVKCLTSSPLTLQMFISCRGIRMLVELLDEDYSVNKRLVLNALEGIESVFSLQSPTPKNEFCRMFVREGIAEPLSTALLNIVKDNSGEAEAAKRQILVLLLLFCQIGQADARIRDAFGSRSFVICLLRSLPHLSPSFLLLALKSIKHLSTSQPLLDVLQNADAIRALIELLLDKLGTPGTNEICSHLLQTLLNLCRLSRSRQEEAAQNGLLPLLQQVLTINSPLKEFALPLLCDMGNSGKSARRQLWKIDGVQSYLNLLSDSYWRVAALEALVAWMTEETARIEDRLLESSAVDALINTFMIASGTSFDNILEPFARLFRLSCQLTRACAQPQLVERISTALSRRTKAMAKLNLLRLIKILCESPATRNGHLIRSDLRMIVEKLSKQDDAVLVRQLAKEILPLLEDFPLVSGATRYDERMHLHTSTSSQVLKHANGSQRRNIPALEQKFLQSNKLNESRRTVSERAPDASRLR
ncbi:hypothetical protein NliqN6_0299 [Naganishia liquefaciens]|uniref:non-specific serine/threonine protein kinase n=1 Tax=Naganishia liquefaciens TaxID=104408 RepID=A0A8H3TML5_9TREE|nr:hypothetical protein NliqN6_0299 [Naganishia liquefaciens]